MFWFEELICFVFLSKSHPHLLSVSVSPYDNRDGEGGAFKDEGRSRLWWVLKASRGQQTLRSRFKATFRPSRKNHGETE